MKHYSSRYTSADHLVAVIKQRLELEGWTVNRYGGFSDPRIGIQLMISRGEAFFCLRSFGESSPYVDYYAASSIGQHGVIVSAASGYSDTAGFVNQPGFQSSPKCYVESGDGAGTCHFFVSDDLVMFVTERVGGFHSCLSFGVLPVLSVGTGGQFVTSTESYLSTQKQSLFSNAYGNTWSEIKHRNGQPLIDTGMLRNSIFGEVRGLSIVLGSPLEYADTHQDGIRVARRMFLPNQKKGLPDKWKNEYVKIITKNIEQALT